MNDTTKNKDLVKGYLAAINARDIDTLVSLCREDVKNHAAIPEAQGTNGVRTIFGKIWKAMPDHEVACEDLIAEGDRVMARIRMSGTQTGPLEFVRSPLPATGRAVSTEQIHVFRIENGKIAEHWAGHDHLGMLRQLGHNLFATNGGK